MSRKISYLRESVSKEVMSKAQEIQMKAFEIMKAIGKAFGAKDEDVEVWGVSMRPGRAYPQMTPELKSWEVDEFDIVPRFRASARKDGLGGEVVGRMVVIKNRENKKKRTEYGSLEITIAWAANLASEVYPIGNKPEKGPQGGIKVKIDAFDGPIVNARWDAVCKVVDVFAKTKNDFGNKKRSYNSYYFYV